MQNFLNQEILIISDTPDDFNLFSWRDLDGIATPSVYKAVVGVIFHSYLRVVLWPASRTLHGHRQRIRSGTFIAFSVDGSGCWCYLHEPMVGWLSWLIASSLYLSLGSAPGWMLGQHCRMTAFLKGTNILRMLNTWVNILGSSTAMSEQVKVPASLIFHLQCYCCGYCIC